MANVGLAVVTYKDNFGSALQTYATQTVVDNLGYHAECIRADGIMSVIESRKKKFYLKHMYCPEEFQYVLSYVTSRFKRTKSNQYASDMKVRHSKYIEFNERYLKLSNDVHSIDELSQLCGQYDTVLVGSDQLWRPSNIAGGYFTLEAVPDSVNKISYSTSFGVGELPKAVHKHAKSFLSRMNHISVRENSGSRIVKDMIARDVPVVCDPTMLLTREAWSDIVKTEPYAAGDYIVCYLMGKQKEYREFIKRLRKVTGYRVVALLHGSTYIAADEEWPDEKPYDVGPCEFINLIQHAKYVCTDSFHCCVFSILNHTPFFTFRRDTERKTTSSNDRIYTLLAWTGLEDRLLTGNEDIVECVKRDIDFNSIQQRVDARRDESLAYLVNALKTN
jgi:hypothetical protein